MSEDEYIKALNDLRVARDVQDMDMVYRTLYLLSVNASDEQWAPILERTDEAA